MITKFNFKDKAIKSYAIRKLTPRECFRLMGVREGVIDTMQGKAENGDMIVSASQQYKQAGNSIVVDVLKSIYTQLWYPAARKEEAMEQSLFADFFGDNLPAEPTDTNKGEKVFVTTFSGYDSQLMAADALREEHPEFAWTCRGWSDIDKYACKMHDLVFPQFADYALGDITKVDWHAVKASLQGREVDMFTYSSPCFVAGTLVLTADGYKPIEEVRQGDKVLTHTNAYHSVVRVGGKREQDIVRVKGMGIDEILCTPNHPFYAREMYRSGHECKRAFREPKWKAAAELTTTDYLGVAVNTLAAIPEWRGVVLRYGGRDSYAVNQISPMLAMADFWYLMGRYVGDGWTVAQYNKVMLSCSDRNETELKAVLDRLGYNPIVTDKEKTCRKYCVCSKELSAFVSRYGRGAAGKCIDAETLALPRELLAAFLRGYTDSDGCVMPHNGECKITTVSRSLAYAAAQVVAKVYCRPARIYKYERSGKRMIEGRECSQRDTFQIVWHTDARKQDKAFYEDGYVWFPCNGVEATGRKADVYNMEVETDNSYTANGVIVHNCQDISQAGKQMGLTEGSETRSALLWRVADAVEVLRPKYLLQENVAALVSDKFMPDFRKWLQRLESLGYVNRWARLNAKDYGVPQNRDRVFCLSMRKDVAFDYRFPAPVKLEKRLADVLEEEVEERFFLKDDAVAKFLKANEKDDCVYVQSAVPPSHENAMFLKTWYTRRCAELGVWENPDRAAAQRLLDGRAAELAGAFGTFREKGAEAFGADFAEEYRRNIERRNGK